MASANETASSPHPSTSTSRLAMVANQRRRQRKQQANSNLDKTHSQDTSSTTISSSSSVVSGTSATTAEDKENGSSHGKDIPRGLSRARHLKRLKHHPRSQLQAQSQRADAANDNATAMSASFDDQSTICSDGIWSTSLQSGMSSKSTATTQDSYHFSPPMTIHSPVPSRGSAGGSGAMRRVTNHRNHQHSLMSSGNSSNGNANKSNCNSRSRSQSPFRREFREAVTPIMGNHHTNHNTSYEKNDVAASGRGSGNRSQFRSLSVGRQRQQPQKQQKQKHTALVLPKSSSKLSLAKRTENPSHYALNTGDGSNESKDCQSSKENERQTQNQQEQELHAKSTIRELQTALEQQRNVCQEKEDIISGLEEELDALALALEDSRKSGGGNNNNSNEEAEKEKNFNEQKISHLQMELNQTTLSLESLKEKHEQLLKQFKGVKERGEEAKRGVNSKMEMDLRKLKDELRAEKEERMEMERRWRECADTLERKQLEDEV